MSTERVKLSPYPDVNDSEYKDDEMMALIVEINAFKCKGKFTYVFLVQGVCSPVQHRAPVGSG